MITTYTVQQYFWAKKQPQNQKKYEARKLINYNLLSMQSFIKTVQLSTEENFRSYLSYILCERFHFILILEVQNLKYKTGNFGSYHLQKIELIQRIKTDVVSNILLIFEHQIFPVFELFRHSNVIYKKSDSNLERVRFYQ
ncbi:Hypothetical_protein [Hexamita inflata]|uniref:Hypothetical_protein n=1 Tax=Hexamita inflata TaxID=28002 RepID=A0AA86QM68_9EUKA|nr:Hypothetical protein HINF_LOCUS49791 [Hexamita inflata]